MLAVICANNFQHVAILHRWATAYLKVMLDLLQLAGCGSQLGLCQLLGGTCCLHARIWVTLAEGTWRVKMRVRVEGGGSQRGGKG